MNFLVTGAASPLGMAVCRRIRTTEARITGVVKPGGNVPPQELVDELIHVDLAEPADFRRIRDRYDAVIHVAALSEGSPDQLMSATGLSAFRLLLRARELEIPTIVHVSSMAVYGNVETPLVSSRTPIRHSSPYGAAKWAAECYLSSGQPSTNCVSVRAPAIVGMRSHRHFLARTLSQMALGVKEVFASNPEFLFNNLIHEETLADFLITLAVTPPRKFVAVPVSSSEPMRLREVLDTLAEATNFKGRITWSSSGTPPFSIDSEEAVSLGLRQLTTRSTLQRWLKKIPKNID